MYRPGGPTNYQKNHVILPQAFKIPDLQSITKLDGILFYVTARKLDGENQLRSTKTNICTGY